MNEIDAFIEKEKKALSWYERPLEIWTTKECTDPSVDIKIPAAETVIKRRGRMFFLLIYSGFMLFCYLKTPYSKTPFYGMLAIHATIYLLYLVISWINPDDDDNDGVASIKLNKEGIWLNKRLINWSDIQETYIMNTRMRIGKGSGFVSYLIIHKVDKTIFKVDTNLLIVSDKKLATLIEYYKNLSE